jgi:nucleoside-diphosphate-sugar epimerase
MRIAITGANGYIGSRIARALRPKHTIVPLGRATTPRFTLDEGFTLDGKTAPTPLKRVDVLIHCAYDFSPRGWHDIYRVNVLGTRRLLREARAADVQRIIVISSMSAFPGCKSLYGRAKLAIEQDARKAKAFIVRPGLVYDKDARGIVGRLRDVARRLPVVPMIGRGKQEVYPCHAEDLAQLIALLCEKDIAPRGVPITAASQRPVTFREIVTVLSGRKPLFVPIPYAAAYAGLRVLEALRLNGGLRTDSLVGMVHTNPDPDFSATRRISVTFRALTRRR